MENTTSGLVFPVKNWTGVDYHVSPLKFNSGRDKGRRHAGCDLYAPEGSEIVAVASGKVVYAGGFYYNTFGIQVDHGPEIGTVFYGELTIASGISKGVSVSAGQVIGAVLQIINPSTGARYTPMLHLEWYSQTGNHLVIGDTKKLPLPYRRVFTPKNAAILLDSILHA